MKLLMYGAGNIGRGFIGQVFATAGYEVVFVDINHDIVDILNKDNSYNVYLAETPQHCIKISGVRAVYGDNIPEIVDEIVSCDIMATSLGAGALGAVAPIIAEGFVKRIQLGKSPLDILICENLKDSASWLLEKIQLNIPEDKHTYLQQLGLIEAAIGRMVPVSTAENGVLSDILVEPYDYLPVDESAFKGSIPDIPQIVPYQPFSFFEERKLYLHNMGHAICACLGRQNGCTFIHEAINDPYVRIAVKNAMIESASMLSFKYSKDFSSVYSHAEDLLMRFSNERLQDTCERVARDPLRKLTAGDRLAGALTECTRANLYPTYIALGFAAFLMDYTKNEIEAYNILHDVSKLNSSATDMVMRLYKAFTSSTPLPKIIKYAECIKSDLRGKTV